jgi:lipoprotein signal peptidase
MFAFQFGSYHYPCFNVADVYICTAAGLLVILSFLPKAKADA